MPPSQPYANPPSQPYVTPLSQPYQPQVPGGQPYLPPQMAPGQPYAPSQVPGGLPYSPERLPPPGAPGGPQGFGQKAMASVPLLASAAQLVGQMTAPVQDETGISPAPFAAQAPGWAHTKPLTDAQLGDRIDGWADTVIGMSDKAPLMIQALVQDLPTHFRPATQSLSTQLGMTGMSTLARGIDMPLSPVALVRIAQSIMPTITVLPRLILRLFGVTIVGKQRDYLFAVTTPGAIVGIMITGAGQDLYMAWDLFLRRVWNEIAIGLLTLIALVVGVIAGFGAVRTASIFANYTSSPSLVLAGAFIGAFISVGLGTFFGVFAIIAILGFIFRRDTLAFFRKSIDLFEVHDITSMSLSVHKALLRAADKAGIDSKLLRAKEGFTTDRDKRVI